MFIINTPSREKASLAAFYANELVNFAIYTLAHSDQTLAPFEHHETTVSLRHGATKADWPDYLEGLDLQAWESWLDRMMRSEVTRSLSEQHRALTEPSSASPLLFDMPFVFNGYPGFNKSLYELYVQGARQLGSLDAADEETYDNPIDYWQGSSAVREKLIFLWNKFRVEPHHNRVYFVSDLAQSFDFEFYRAINDALRDELGEVETFIPFFFVRYSMPVFYTGSTSVVLGFPEQIDNDALIELLREAAQSWLHRAVSDVAHA